MLGAERKTAEQLVKEYVEMEAELKATKAKIPELERKMESNFNQARSMIMQRKGSSGHVFMDHVIARYNAVDLRLAQILDNVNTRFEESAGDLGLIITMASDKMTHYYLGVIDKRGLSFSDDYVSVYFPFSKSYTQWRNNSTPMVSKVLLGNDTSKDFSFNLLCLDNRKTELPAKTQLFIGDAEVWKFFKSENDNSFKDKVRKAFKLLKIEKTYTW